MACDAELLKQVPLFSLLDDEERAVLATHVEMRRMHARQMIYRRGDRGGKGYVVVEGRVRVSLIDEDQQEVTLDEPGPGEFFGFTSLLEASAHQTDATALEAVTCLEVEREDLMKLLHAKPEAGMDMLTVLGRQFRGAQKLVQMRSLRNPNEVIEEGATFGDHVADAVARFGGSWRFIILCLSTLIVYVLANAGLGSRAWDPYPYILLNLFLSMLAAIQAPVIMMSQNRQDAKDRLRSELDFDVNRRAETEIRGLSARMYQMSLKMEDLEKLVRQNPAHDPSLRD